MKGVFVGASKTKTIRCHGQWADRSQSQCTRHVMRCCSFCVPVFVFACWFGSYSCSAQPGKIIAAKGLASVTTAPASMSQERAGQGGYRHRGVPDDLSRASSSTPGNWPSRPRRPRSPACSNWRASSTSMKSSAATAGRLDKRRSKSSSRSWTGSRPRACWTGRIATSRRTGWSEPGRPGPRCERAQRYSRRPGGRSPRRANLPTASRRKSSSTDPLSPR